MSSIAYITDNTMIEFHRLNGNSQLNFWKPSKNINFADFQTGDLLFFLAKGTERHKEKGIIGYGCYQQGERMSPQQAWNRFAQLNGYHTKEDFFNAIMKVSANQQLPKKIGCLFLKDVVYFQNPLYLSELDVHVSNRVQSYIYLDNDNDSLTRKILQLAKHIGVDMWSLSINEHSSNELTIEQDRLRHLISKISDYLNYDFYSLNQLKKLRSFMKKNIDQLDEGFEFVKGGSVDCCHFDQQKISICIPLMAFSKDHATQTQFTLGRLIAYRSLLEREMNADYEIQLNILSAQELHDATKAIFEQQKIVIKSIIE